MSPSPTFMQAIANTVLSGETPLGYVRTANYTATSYNPAFIHANDDYLLVGVPSESVYNNENQGLVEVRHAKSSNFSHRLVPSDELTLPRQSGFGRTLALHGSSALVGTGSFEDPNDPYYTPPGNIYLFDLTNPSATEVRQFVPTGGKVIGYGARTAMYGDYVIASSYQDPSTTGSVFVFSASTGNQLYKLTAPDTTTRFGVSVAIYGTKLAVGSADAVYLFDVASATLLHKFTSCNAVAIHDNRIIVTDTNYLDARIYDATTYSLITSCIPSIRTAAITVDISQSYAIVAAYGSSVGGRTSSGLITVFDPATGQELHQLSDGRDDNNTRFGFGAQIVGSTVYATGNGTVKLPLYMLDLDNAVTNTIYAQASIPLPTPVAGSEHGNTIAAMYGHGNYAGGKFSYIGAYGYAPGLDSDAGGGYLSTLPDGGPNNPNSYPSQSNITRSPSVVAGDRYGEAAAYVIGNSRVGAPFTDLNGFSNAGIVYMGANSSSFACIPSVQSTNAYFGLYVAYDSRSGRTIALAPGEDSFNGTIYTFDYLTVEDLRITLPTGGDPSLNNRDFSLAASGGYMAVGRKGAVYIYKVSDGALVYTLTVPNALSESFGTSVAMSDGIVVVGAEDADTIYGSSRGALYVFELDTGAMINKLAAVNGASGDGLGYSGYDSIAISGRYAVATTRNASWGYVFDINSGIQIAIIPLYPSSRVATAADYIFIGDPSGNNPSGAIVAMKESF